MEDAGKARIGVVIPLYNQRALVSRAVRSVLGQSYRDLSLIVVDDGSTDGGAEWVERLPDSRVRVLYTGKNRGPGAARNLGIRACDTEWVGLLDADDEWAARFLGRTIEAARGIPDLSVVFAHFSIAGEEPRPAQLPEGIVDDYFSARLERGVSMTSSSVLVHRERLLALGGFLEGCRYGEDIEAWLRLACSERLYFIPQPLCSIHTETPHSLTKAADSSERVKGLESLLDTYARYRSAGRIPARIEKSCKAFAANQCACLALHMIKSGHRFRGLSTLLMKVRPSRHNWREYCRCLSHAVAGSLVR